MKELKKTSNQNLIEVTKANGEREPFSINKVYNSALRAGASFSSKKILGLDIRWHT